MYVFDRDTALDLSPTRCTSSPWSPNNLPSVRRSCRLLAMPVDLACPPDLHSYDRRGTAGRKNDTETPWRSSTCPSVEAQHFIYVYGRGGAGRASHPASEGGVPGDIEVRPRAAPRRLLEGRSGPHRHAASGGGKPTSLPRGSTSTRHRLCGYLDDSR